jgi:hypothetical protein
MSYKWHESCSPGWKQQDNTFEFYLTKGIAGNCPSDNTPMEGKYEFKERQELMGDMLDPGTYVWSADVETISDKLVHAEYFFLLQIHDKRPNGRPPHGIQVRRGSIFLIQEDDDTELYVSKYKGQLSIATKVHVKRKRVSVEYIIDGVNVAKLKSKAIGQPFIKFGAYRWNAVCDVKQIYRNLRFERTNVS